MHPPSPFPGLDSLGNGSSLTSTLPMGSSDMTAIQMLNNLLAAHPHLASAVHASPGATSDSAAPSPASALAQAPLSSTSHVPNANAQQGANAPQSSTTTAWTLQAKPGSTQWKKEMATRDFSTFPNPDKMYFTDSDAKRECPQYGKNFITRDENGNPLSKEAMHEIEKGVRFHCNLMLQVPEEDQDFKGDDFQNFMWWRQNQISTLIKAATAIELDHPELAWGLHHYKTLKWIEKHLKYVKSSKTRAENRVSLKSNGGNNSLRASSQASSSKTRKTAQTAPTRQAQSEASSSSNNKRKANDSASLQSPAKKVKAPASAAHDSDSDFSVDTDSESPRKAQRNAPKKKTPVDKLNDIAKRRHAISDLVDGSDEEIAQYTVSQTASSTLKNISNSNADAAGAKKQLFAAAALSQLKTRDAVSAKEAFPPQLSATTALSHLKTGDAGASFKLPNRSTTPMTKESAPSASFKLPARSTTPTTSASTPPAPSLLALSSLRHANAVRLETPTIAAIRLALSSRFAALTPRKDVEEALQVLETAQGCGNEPRQGADNKFESWLSQLEQLAPDHTDDEDELGQGFGHKQIGEFPYRTALQLLDSWGSIEHALRLLSALLRIWSIGTSQLSKDATSDLQPLVHNHVKSVAELIKTAFKISTSTPSTSAASTSTSSSNQEAQAGPSKRRLRVKMSLNKGIVTVDALKRLTKTAAAELLTEAEIYYSSQAKKQDLIDILGKALSTNRIKITADQYYAALNGVKTDHSDK